MADDTIDPMLDEMAGWAETSTRELKGNSSEAEMLLQLLRDHLGVDDPSELTKGDLEELLLEVYPRKVTVLRTEDASAVIPTVRDLLAFLEDTGRMSDGALKELRREVDAVEPRFPDAVMDPSNWGWARALTQSMVDSGVDPTDDSAVQRWIEEFNTRIADGEQPDGALGGLGGLFDLDGDEDEASELDWKDAFDLPDELPGLRLPGEAQLADHARASALVARARELALWIGASRDLVDGELGVEDALAAARTLEMHVPEQGVREMRDLPELAWVWELAHDLEFLEIGVTQATPGPALGQWPDGEDELVLDLWQTALALTLETGVDGQTGAFAANDLDFTGAGAATYLILFLAREDGVSSAELSEMIQEHATASLPAEQAGQAWERWVDERGDPASILLGTLADLGAVEIDSDTGTATITPLGLYAMRLQLIDAGVAVPLIPPVEEMTAADLVAFAEGADEQQLIDESTAWLRLQNPGHAADELLGIAAAGSAAERVITTSIAMRIGPGAEQRWRTALDDHRLRAYAKMALAKLDGTEPEDAQAGFEPTTEDLAWLLTDMIGATMHSLDSDELASQLGEALPAGEPHEIIEQMWRLDHPQAHAVLTVIGKHHPEKNTAKAARKAAFKVEPGGR